MIKEVKTPVKTTQEEIEELTKEAGDIFFTWGRCNYELELKQKQIGELSVKAHNLNATVLKLNERLAKEKARESVVEVKLSEAPANPLAELSDA